MSDPGPGHLPAWARQPRLSRQRPVDPTGATGGSGARPTDDIVVDLEMPLEQVFDILIGLGVIWTLVALNIGLLGGKHSPPQPEVLRHLPFSLGLGLIGAWLRWCTDCHYILRAREGRLDYHRRFLGLTTEYPLLDARDIECVAVAGERLQSKQGPFFLYKIVLVTGQGELVPMSTVVREDGREGLNRQAGRIARLFDRPLLAGPSEHRLEVAWSGAGPVTVRQVPQPLAAAAAGGQAGQEISLLRIGCGVVVALALFVLVGVVARLLIHP